MSIALFKCNDEVTQKTVSSMLEKYIISYEMLTKTFIVKIHSAYHTSKNIGIISFWLCFLQVPRFPPPIKTGRHHITEILLKVTLNTITLTLPHHALIRTESSSLSLYYLFKEKMGQDPFCTCKQIVTSEHFLLYCNTYQ